MFFDRTEPSETLVYSGITPEVFSRLRERLGSHGVSVADAPHGRLTAFGVAGEYDWDSENGSLEIRITDKPFLIPHHLIVAYFREAIVEAGGVPS
jgi:hypothetical protein